MSIWNRFSLSATRWAKSVILPMTILMGVACLSSTQTESVVEPEQLEQIDDLQEGLFDYETTQDQDKELFEQSELGPGVPAPELELAPLTDSGLGSPVKLSSLYKEKPLVLFMGSCTCGLTKEKAPQLEKMYEEYGEEAQFAFVYMKDAHPSPDEAVEVDGKEVQLAQPSTMSHRIELARCLLNETGLTLPMFIDDMKGTGRKTYSSFHLAAYVIDVGGELVLAERYKYDVAEVESALVTILEAD